MTTQSKTSLLGFAGAFFLAAFVLLCTGNAVAQPQQGGKPNSPDASNTGNITDELKQARAENEALTRILSAIESIDTARQNELIQWIITDRNIRTRVISALRKAGKNISPNSVAELTVTQKPPTEPGADLQLLRLVIESVGIYGEPNIKRILGESLYERIKQRDYEHTMISTELIQNKIQSIYMDLSAFGGQIIFKSGFGVGYRVGNDYLGYPFWLPGTYQLYGMIRRGTTDFRAGVELPLGDAGATPFKLSGESINIKPRKLLGSTAFAAQVDQDLGLLSEQSGRIHAGAEFLTSFSPNPNNYPNFARESRYRTSFPRNSEKDSLYYIGLSGHAYASYRLPDNVLRGAYVQLGAGYHRINAITVGPLSQAPNTGTDFSPVESGSFGQFDPFIKLGYVRSGEAGDEYGLSIQYCNTLLTHGFFKLFPWLQLEFKYATVIFRDVQKWEHKDFVMVSPKLIFNF